MDFQRKWYYRVIYIVEMLFIWYLLGLSIVRMFTGGDWVTPMAFFLTLNLLAFISGMLLYLGVQTAKVRNSLKELKISVDDTDLDVDAAVAKYVEQEKLKHDRARFN